MALWTGLRRGSGVPSHAVVPAPTCATYWRRLSVRMAGSGPRPRAMRRPDGAQEFLSRARWNADAVRDELQAYVVEHLADPGAVLVLDRGPRRPGDGPGTP